ncbi:hypothetical protein CLV51_104441 [Chitinophaga niastensis]|uniref:Uncharacterized protein n=1 Tax=Chitinophaga niastensis TaxID=536980 RepID=A0A2P8HHN0_CHINA|nr:hypothetical protein CLV51_104441 [Chitinophaga niastensis]
MYQLNGRDLLLTLWREMMHYLPVNPDYLLNTNSNVSFLKVLSYKNGKNYTKTNMVCK